MKLLFLMEHLYPIVGGAEKSIDSLIQALRKKPGIEIACISRSSAAADAATIDAQIAQCDVVITQLRWSAAAIQQARHFKKKSVLFVRSYECLCRVADDILALSHCGHRCGSCQYRLALPAKPDLIVANSRYMQRLLKAEHCLESEIIYPFIDPAEVLALPGDRKFITMNQRSYHKGADVFLQIAAAMPELDFRIAGAQEWLPMAVFPENVCCSGPLSPKELYADTRVFLAPARWGEPFGRMVIEAQLNSIPVLATKRGAPWEDGLLPAEYLVDDPDDIRTWVEKLSLLLAHYDAEVEQVRERSFASFSLDRNVEVFYQMLLGLTGAGRLPSAGLFSLLAAM